MSRDSEQPLMTHMLTFAPFDKASDGYLLAKRQMTDALDHKIQKLKDEISSDWKEEIKIKDEIKILEHFRNYVRNGMLWCTNWGK